MNIWIFRRSFRKSVAHKPDVRKQLDDFEDHRPYFTYWITTVQILILIISLACYGFGPIGMGLTQKSGLVRNSFLYFHCGNIIFRKIDNKKISTIFEAKNFCTGIRSNFLFLPLNIFNIHTILFSHSLRKRKKKFTYFIDPIFIYFSFLL